MNKIHRCTICPFTTENRSSFSKHNVLKHALDTENFMCYTCQRCYPNIEGLARHHRTVLHQLNCKKVSEDPAYVPERDLWTSLNSAEKFMSYMYPVDDLPNQPKKRRKTDVKDLRTSPAIIPLHSTIKQKDPRLYREEISFLDLPGVTLQTKDEEDEPNIPPEPVVQPGNTPFPNEENHLSTPTRETDDRIEYSTINIEDFHDLNMNLFNPEEWVTTSQVGTTDF